MKQITVNGNTYKSISEAWRELESPVPEVTVRWRLKNGWTPEEAFNTEPVPPQTRRAMKNFRLGVRELNED